MVVIARFALFALAVAAVPVAWQLGRGHGHASSAPGSRFVCAMHPDVVSLLPGRCPICGMALEMVAPTPSSNAASFRYVDVVRQRSFGADVIASGWLDSDGTISAIIYKDEVVGLASDLLGSFTPTRTPQLHLPISWIQEEPRSWDRSTVVARFRLATSDVAVARDAVGWIKVATRRRDQLVIPAAALLEGDAGPFVLVADGTQPSRRAVTVGRVSGGMAFIVSGLRQRERVVVRDAFFFDAERRLHGGGGAP
jgi:hypothetical protein